MEWDKVTEGESKKENRQQERERESAGDPYSIIILILSAFIMQKLTSKPAPHRQE